MAKELLADTGSVFVQISDENAHRVRVLMDEVFGVQNFVAQVNYRTMTPLGSSGMSQVYDYLLWYAKEKGRAKYTPIYEQTDISGDNEYTYVDAAVGAAQKLTRDEKQSFQDQARIFGFGFDLVDRQAYYDAVHPQTIEFELAKEIVRALTQTVVPGKEELRQHSRAVLFPQVLRIVRRYVATGVDLAGCHPARSDYRPMRNVSSAYWCPP